MSDESEICCEWYEEATGSVSTSCGVRIKYPDEHSRCPKCKGSIVFLDYEDDDDTEYYDDE